MTESPLKELVNATRGKDFYEGTWWDENGEAAWFPCDKWEAWEAVAGFAYYLQDGDLELGETIQLVGKVTLHPDCEPGDKPDEDCRWREVQPENFSPADTVEVWKVRIR